MKSKIKILALILTIVFSLTIFPFNRLFPAVKATYVEGEIGRNTVWTLVDSPFVISGNVTVKEGVTLTIEPGVEVRFGGKYSLIVNGTLIAKGTFTPELAKLIKFTSNSETPKLGDWGTIHLNGTGQPPSLLENCVIEYGTNGITLENGELILRSSDIHLNSENGILVLNGSITIEHYVGAVNNTASGIYICGGNAIIKNTFIASNDNGITLTGNLTSSNITITQNQISNNQHTGISLKMENYDEDNFVVTNNVLSGNYYGFYVSTNASTLITHNYIYNNNFGVFYEKGIGHKAHFNDIYGNALGMDVSANTAVDAMRNYWGDKSGPHHEMLNPYGKGNAVGGNGVNLDFIFFLTAPIDYANTPPTAVLLTDKIVVTPGQEVAFVGFDSFDEGRVDQYFFDFGDGSSTGWTTLSIFFHSYAAIGEYSASLRVMDDFGSISSPASINIHVANLPSLDVELTPSSNKVPCSGEISVTAYVSSGGTPVEGANVTFFSIKGGIFVSKSGLTNSSGYFVTSFMAPDVTDITDVRIIARASKNEFADGSDHQYLTVLPPLTVDVTSDSSKVLSEGTSMVSVYVSWVGAPVQGATVTLSSTSGSFTESEKVTDSSGKAVFTFNAPQTSEEIVATIVARASKVGYADGVGQTFITITPKMLNVVVNVERNVTVSEELVRITVHVEYDGASVQEANVTVSADAGKISPTSAYTDSYGDAVFNFTAPQVEQETNIIITASVSKIGYATNTSTLTLTTRPGNLTIEIVPSTYSVAPGKTVDIVVRVKCDGRPVANASVTAAASAGTLTPQSSGTDADGYCVFSLLAPDTSETIMVTVNATKYGYVGSSTSVSLTVVPEAGIPWITVLLILIPVLLVVVVVILVKFGVISVSFGEGESGSVS
ncbi:MAG: right-handed parallel beta-helix repeat-containing protein [Candidatus Bathyarchaeia archaeon]